MLAVAVASEPGILLVAMLSSCPSRPETSCPVVWVFFPAAAVVVGVVLVAILSSCPSGSGTVAGNWGFGWEVTVHPRRAVF